MKGATLFPQVRYSIPDTGHAGLPRGGIGLEGRPGNVMECGGKHLIVTSVNRERDLIHLQCVLSSHSLPGLHIRRPSLLTLRRALTSLFSP